MFDHSDHAHVAWDVETTGFGWTDGITVSGLWFPGGHATLVLNSGPHHADGEQLAESLTDTSEAAVRVRVAEDENELLTPMGRVLFERFDREYNRLGAYNADSWQGGSGLPSSARRASSRASTGRSTVSRPPTCGSRSGNDSARPRRRTDRRRGRNSPTGAHTILFDSTRRESVLDGSDGHVWYAEYDYDPFADSGSAAARYREADFLPRLQSWGSRHRRAPTAERFPTRRTARWGCGPCQYGPRLRERASVTPSVGCISVPQTRQHGL